VDERLERPHDFDRPPRSDPLRHDVDQLEQPRHIRLEEDRFVVAVPSIDRTKCPD
jgi:hypothetical protein